MLDADNPRDPAKLIRTSKEIAEHLRKQNAGVAIYLMATWPRADQTYPSACSGDDALVSLFLAAEESEDL